MANWLNDWEDGFCPSWRGVVGADGPSCEAISDQSTIESCQLIYPRRYLHSTQPQNAPDGSHIYRALNDLPPDRVAVVFMGQDPYTTPARATGRSFEAGDRIEWHQVGRVRSLYRICQQLAANSTGDPQYQLVDSWKLLRKRLINGQVPMPTVRETFDNWQREGVLLINQSLTATTRAPGMNGDYPHLRDHLALWEPMVHRICYYLARKRNVVFVLLGKKAEGFFDAIPGVPAEVRLVRRNHPAFTERHTGNCPFLSGPNLFREINDGLRRVGREPVNW